MSLKEIPKDIIDVETFGQILEMDDDDDREFSRAIVEEFFTQAETTFRDMDGKLKDGDLLELSSLGHFLKGSSATLGLIKIKNACEIIQNLGAGLDESGLKKHNNNADALKKIRARLTAMKTDYDSVKDFFSKCYPGI